MRNVDLYSLSRSGAADSVYFSMAEGRLPEFQVRKMLREDIPKALDVWRETGLVEGTHTLDTWYEVDPDGFYIAVAADSNEVLGVCSGIIIPDDDIAFIGLYAVREKVRGMGVGKKIWQAMMEHVGDLNAGLNSVPEHLHTYRDLAGFGIVSPWVTVIFESETLTPENLVSHVSGVTVQPAEDDMIPRVIEYDASIHGRRRDAVVRLSCRELDSLTMVAIQDGGEVCGYGTLRGNVQKTALAGPLYAKSAEVAELVLRRLVEEFQLARDEGMTLAVISQNQDSFEVAEKLGLKKSLETPRCYTKKEVEVDFSQIYAQHSLNFCTF